MTMRRAGRTRIIFETVLTAVSALTLILTLVAHDWIERTTGLKPDGGSGTTEWLLTGGALVATLVLGSITTRDLRRTRAASVTS